MNKLLQGGKRMKKWKYCLSIVLTITLLVQTVGLQAYADIVESNIVTSNEIIMDESAEDDMLIEKTVGSDINILNESIDETNNFGLSVFEADDTVYYLYSDLDVSYCSQISANGKIQFSYTYIDSEVIAESRVYELDELYTRFNIDSAKEDECYNLINEAILANLELFQNLVLHNNNEMISGIENGELSIGNGENAETLGFSELEDAIKDIFGDNYSNKTKGTASKTYNGKKYTVKCLESQSTSNTAIRSRAFSSETPVTTLYSWVTSDDFTWVGLIKTIISKVVKTVVKDGMNYLKNGFTAKRTNVSCMRTRNVKVSGYSSTPYWAGWTRKIYCFKGEPSLGWTHDTGFNSNIKHSDYDDISKLMTTGFNNYINDL